MPAMVATMVDLVIHSVGLRGWIVAASDHGRLRDVFVAASGHGQLRHLFSGVSWWDYCSE